MALHRPPAKQQGAADSAIRVAHSSIDSERLLRCVDDEARRAGRTTDILLQLHVAREETKYGFTLDECRALADNGIIDSLANVRIRGVMGMATNTDDETEIHREFHAIRNTFEQLKASHFDTCPYFDTVSMGMSHDYRIAIDEGTTMVRIGTTIFGPARILTWQFQHPTTLFLPQ